MVWLFGLIVNKKIGFFFIIVNNNFYYRIIEKDVFFD